MASSKSPSFYCNICNSQVTGLSSEHNEKQHKLEKMDTASSESSESTTKVKENVEKPSVESDELISESSSLSEMAQDTVKQAQPPSTPPQLPPEIPFSERLTHEPPEVRAEAEAINRLVAEQQAAMMVEQGINGAEATRLEAAAGSRSPLAMETSSRESQEDSSDPNGGSVSSGPGEAPDHIPPLNPSPEPQIPLVPVEDDVNMEADNEDSNL